MPNGSNAGDDYGLGWLVNMERIYNSSGVEVKKTIKGVCPTCGLGRCGGFTHCLRCGQPLLYTEPYVEFYKNLDDEIAAIDALTQEEKTHLGIDIDTMSLKKRREQVLKGIGIVEYDVKALRDGKLFRVLSDKTPNPCKKDTDKKE